MLIYAETITSGRIIALLVKWNAAWRTFSGLLCSGIRTAG